MPCKANLMTTVRAVARQLAGQSCRPRANRKPTHLFTRLNIARSARTFEHEDLVARYRPAEVVSDQV